MKKVIFIIFALVVGWLNPGLSFSQEKPEVFVQLGHTDDVNSVAFSPDGRYALSGSRDNTVKLWDIQTDRDIRTFKGHTDKVNSVDFSPDGRYVLSGSDDVTVRLWDIKTGKEIVQSIGFKDGEWVAITPEGYYNASPNGDKYLNVRIGNNIYSIENYREAFYRPDIVRLALAGKSEAKLFEAKDIDPQIYFDRAIEKLNVATKREDLKEVAKYFEIAKELSPEWLDVYYNLGLIYDKLDYYDKAYENYTKYFDFLKNRNAPLEEQTKVADLLVKASVNNGKLNEIKEKMVKGVWFYPSLAPGLKPCTVSSFGRFCGDKVDLSNVSFILDKEIPQQRFYIIRSKVYNFGPISYFYPKFNVQSNGKVWNRNIIEYEYGYMLEKEEAMKEAYLTILALKESLNKFPWFEVVWDGRFFEIRHVFIFILPSSDFPYYAIDFYLFKGEIRIDAKPNFIIIREYRKSDRAPGDENFDKVLNNSFNKLKKLNIDDFKFSKELRFIYKED